MTYTNTEKWSLLRQIDQLDTNYFGLTNDHRQVEAGRMAEGRNLIEQTVAYDATAACTFLNLLDRRDDAIRCNDRFAYHHVDEATNLLRSIHPQLLDRRDDAIRCNDRFAYHHVDEATNLLRSIHPQLPDDEPYPYGEPDNDSRYDDEPGTHDLSSLPF